MDWFIAIRLFSICATVDVSNKQSFLDVCEFNCYICNSTSLRSIGASSDSDLSLFDR